MIANQVRRVAKRVGGGIFLLNDTFTDTDGVSLPAHTPETGGPWVILNGGMVIKDNGAKGTTGGAEQIAAVDVGLSDVIITCDIKAGTNRGVLYRSTNALNFFLIIINSGNRRIELFERTSGSYFLRSFSSQWALGEVIDGSVYQMVVTLSGNDQTGVLTGETTTHNVFRTTANKATNTLHGMRSFAEVADELMFDCITIE